ncbi:nuclear transport factor 2 family protein [Mammaliicoccus sciuri]|uniref:nuclear transport factor 2 family protein n=1 Tax=Mammaliicoccus sciuri TaxID=1296 RepID=UPI001E64A90A|nr:ketosteroid isomerase [Mammaliicoccus sciuri]MCD8898511.1 ketosteroid isomerase [Mammaliicoccus sciuri]
MVNKHKLYKEKLKKTYLLTANGKLDEFKKYLSNDVIWTEAVGFPYAGTYVGPDEVVKNVHERLGTEWSNYSAKDIIYAFNDNNVMVYGKYKGTYKLTNKSFEADFVHIYEFDKNDYIKKFVQVVDSVMVLQATK